MQRAVQLPRGRDRRELAVRPCRAKSHVYVFFFLCVEVVLMVGVMEFLRGFVSKKCSAEVKDTAL